MIGRTFFCSLFRNDFLENSRYARIARHVASTMETVNINEIDNGQALSPLVKAINVSFRSTDNYDERLDLYYFSYLSIRMTHSI